MVWSHTWNNCNLWQGGAASLWQKFETIPYLLQNSNSGLIYLPNNLFFRLRNTNWTTSKDLWMPSWYGPNWKEEKSLNRFQTGTMLKSQKNWDVDGNHFQVSLKFFTFTLRILSGLLLKIMIYILQLHMYANAKTVVTNMVNIS